MNEAGTIIAASVEAPVDVATSTMSGDQSSFTNKNTKKRRRRRSRQSDNIQESHHNVLGVAPSTTMAKESLNKKENCRKKHNNSYNNNDDSDFDTVVDHDDNSSSNVMTEDINTVARKLRRIQDNLQRLQQMEQKYLTKYAYFEQQQKQHQQNLISWGSQRAYEVEEYRRRTPSQEEQWMKMYERLKLYKSLHQGQDPPKVLPEDRQLGNWINTQRNTLKRQRIPSHRIQLLLNIGFDFDPTNMLFATTTKQNTQQIKQTKTKKQELIL